MSDINGFEVLGLDESIVEHVHTLGYLRPTAFQREAVPVIARGTHAIGVTSAGSGKTLACALGLAARLDPDGPPSQALVLRPTDDRAAATAETMYRVASAVDLSVLQLRERAPVGSAGAHLLVASPAAALTALERSLVKLGDLETLIIDGASAIFGLGGGDALETIIASVPKEAQRVVLTAERDPAVQDCLERHVRRARELIPPLEVEPLSGAVVEFHAGPETGWPAVLMGALDAAAGKGVDRTVIHCRRELEALDLADAIVVRGFHLAEEPDEAGVHVIWGEGSAIHAGDVSVSWGSPPDPVSFRARTHTAARVLVLLNPREMPHLERLAASLEIRLTPTKAATPPEALTSLQETRDLLSDAARVRDLEPYLLMLEPLLDEWGAPTIAAAATALLRERAPAAPDRKLPAWTRVYFGVGRRDGVRPADIVGAITGESPVSGEQLGRIEIRDTYTLVEVEANAADRVIRGLSSATIRGRPAGVRLYRE